MLEVMAENFWTIFMQGLTTTLPLALGSFSLALVIAILAALARYGKVPVLTQIIKFYVWLIRGTPLLVQLMIGFYGVSSLGYRVNPWVAAVIVFALNEGAYCSETMRGALEAVPPGQLEAGYCVGMNYVQIMWHIVLPQAMRTALPSLMNSLISMVKDTSLASSITVTEMLYRSQRIAGKNYKFMAMYTLVALVYLIFCTVLTYLQSIVEKKLNHYGRKG